MALTVKQRGDVVATLRHIHVRLMEIAASWVPTTPEMEAKLLFGAHVWDLAQHADALGRRTYELRLPLQHSLPPPDAYRALLEEAASAAETAERLALLYDGVLPALAERFASYRSRTDTLLDAPTVRIIDHLAAEHARMRRDRNELLGQRPELAAPPAVVERVAAWRAREAATGAFPHELEAGAA